TAVLLPPRPKPVAYPYCATSARRVTGWADAAEKTTLCLTPVTVVLVADHTGPGRSRLAKVAATGFCIKKSHGAGTGYVIVDAGNRYGTRPADTVALCCTGLY